MRGKKEMKCDGCNGIGFYKTTKPAMNETGYEWARCYCNPEKGKDVKHLEVAKEVKQEMTFVSERAASHIAKGLMMLGFWIGLGLYNFQGCVPQVKTVTEGIRGK